MSRQIKGKKQGNNWKMGTDLCEGKQGILLQSCNWTVESDSFPMNLNMQHTGVGTVKLLISIRLLTQREREGNGVGERKVQRVHLRRERERERESGRLLCSIRAQLHLSRWICGSHFLNAS
jgi:hypothetical protein